MNSDVVSIEVEFGRSPTVKVNVCVLEGLNHHGPQRTGCIAQIEVDIKWEAPRANEGRGAQRLRQVLVNRDSGP